MSNVPEPEFVEPTSLKLLRILVTVLTGVMIAGIVLIVALIWMRYSDRSAPLPERISLPDGTQAEAFTAWSGGYAIVTRDNRILIYNRDSGLLTREIDLTSD